MFSEEEINERVKRGAEFFDKVDPGWYLSIDLSKLSLTNSCNCIVGQLAGNFWNYERYWNSLDEATNHGVYLLTEDGECVSSLNPAWELMDEAWISEIKDRVNRL